MTSGRKHLALVATIAAGVAATGCGDDSEETDAPVSEESSETTEDVFATPNENKEDYKEILDQVQEAAEEPAP